MRHGFRSSSMWMTCVAGRGRRRRWGAHGEGVDAVGGVDPEALAGEEVVGAGGHEAAEAVQ